MCNFSSESSSLSPPSPATYDETLISKSYILGGEELHPLCDLVAEAQKIIIGENGRVADDQVQSATTLTRWQGEMTNVRGRRESEGDIMNEDFVLLSGNSACPVTAWVELKLMPFICCNVCLHIRSGLRSKSKLCSLNYEAKTINLFRSSTSPVIKKSSFHSEIHTGQFLLFKQLTDIY